MESTLSGIEHIITPFPCCLNSITMHERMFSHYVHFTICPRSLEKWSDGRCHPYTHFFLQADEGTQLRCTISGPLWVRKDGTAWKVGSPRKCLNTQALDSCRPGLHSYLCSLEVMMTILISQSLGVLLMGTIIPVYGWL